MVDEVKQQKIIEEQNQVAEYLRRNYIIPYLKGEIQDFNFEQKKDLGTDKIIWQFWGQGEDINTPEIVRASFASIEKHAGEYQRICLNIQTIQDYLDLPDFVYEKLKTKKDFSYAFFADILRISLLSTYGGVWIDSTILLTDNISSEILNHDFFMFQRSKRPDDYENWENINIDYWGWDKDFRVNVLNSFIVSKKNHKITNAIKTILLNYWYKEEKYIHYFLFQILFDELMKIDEFKELNSQIISDTIPHLLHYYKDEDYTKELWNKITSATQIHKLSYFDCKPNSIFENALFLSLPQWEKKLKKEYNDITFCSMLFNLKSKKIDKIKKADRTFEKFYLESLSKLSKNYKNLVMWVDEETQAFIESKNLNIKTRVMKFEELPYYKNRNKYLNFLKEMKKCSFNQGYLLNDIEPEDVVDYLILVLSKIDVVKWARDNDFYNAKYFYWIDAGTNNRIYQRFWCDFEGTITSQPKTGKFAFMTNFKKIYKSIIDISSWEDIALIKAPFEIPASMFMLNKNIVDTFYSEYKSALLFLEGKRFITTEQGIFSTMLKRGNYNLFEFGITSDYKKVMNIVSNK